MTAQSEFFVGWRAHPGQRTARRLAIVAACLLGIAATLGIVLAGAADDPTGRLLAGGSELGPEYAGEIELEGTILDGPSPLLFVPPGRLGARGHALLLSGDGKTGPGSETAALRGNSVTARGVVIRRGTIDMLILSDTPQRAAAKVSAPLPQPEQLGRWRIAGEICDGKCAAGAMRPGSGIAHRACATLCIDGDIPAIFVTTAPVAGHGFLLLADAAGAAPMPAFRDWIGQRIVLEGEVIRFGDIAVFHSDPPNYGRTKAAP
jgi:hypothetical protein